MYLYQINLINVIPHWDGIVFEILSSTLLATVTLPSEPTNEAKLENRTSHSKTNRVMQNEQAENSLEKQMSKYTFKKILL